MKTRDDLKGFLKQHPKTAKVLGTVFTVWRGSTATRSGTEGQWAAHKHEKWSEKTGLPVATLKRHLDFLEDQKLIERQRGPYAGTPGMSFIRPTVLALDLSDTRPGDRERLGLNAVKANKKAKPTPVATLKKPEEPKATWEQVQAALFKK